MQKKERLDVLLVKRGYFESREKARQNIMAGLVFVDNIRVDKSGEGVLEDAKIEVKGNAIPYVSRGGLKLERAMEQFNISLIGKICMDVGASTGGFTDCMLKNGASKVYAVDVGYGQLAWELRCDDRVKCMERTNIRYVTPSDIEDKLDFSSIDVSFISLKLVLPAVKNLLKDDGEIAALIKPQFEAGREKVGKKGVVSNPLTHKEVISKIIDFAREIGFEIKGLTFSPIKGPEGNIEFLLYIKGSSENNINTEDNQINIDEVVKLAHDSLDKN